MLWDIKGRYDRWEIMVRRNCGDHDSEGKESEVRDHLLIVRMLRASSKTADSCCILRGRCRHASNRRYAEATSTPFSDTTPTRYTNPAPPRGSPSRDSGIVPRTGMRVAGRVGGRAGGRGGLGGRPGRSARLPVGRFGGATDRRDRRRRPHTPPTPPRARTGRRRDRPRAGRPATTTIPAGRSPRPRRNPPSSVSRRRRPPDRCRRRGGRCGGSSARLVETVGPCATEVSGSGRRRPF